LGRVGAGIDTVEDEDAGVCKYALDGVRILLRCLAMCEMPLCPLFSVHDLSQLHTEIPSAASSSAVFANRPRLQASVRRHVNIKYNGIQGGSHG
jgi:hypothetical protein